MNAAAWPPFEPTLRIVTAGFEVAVVGVGVEGGDLLGAAERVAIRRPVVLDRLADDAGARSGRGVDLEVLIGQRRTGGRQSEQAGQLRIGPARDQVAARLHPVAQHLGLGGAQRSVSEDRDVVRVQGRRRDVGDVGRGEFVQSLGAQDLGEVAAERVGGVRDHQDRAARSLVGWRWRWRRGREGPGRVGGEGVGGARVVSDAAGPALHGRRVGGRVLQRGIRGQVALLFAPL